jgi:hypothetical protein
MKWSSYIESIYLKVKKMCFAFLKKIHRENINGDISTMPSFSISGSFSLIPGHMAYKTGDRLESRFSLKRYKFKQTKNYSCGTIGLLIYFNKINIYCNNFGNKMNNRQDEFQNHTVFILKFYI